MSETDQPAPPSAGTRTGARERILAAAAELFYREGVRAVGIDAVIEKAGVAKMSLYRAFPSKDALIAAFLTERDQRYWQWWDKVVARHPGNPRAQVLALFEDLAAKTSSPSFRGCPFLNVAIEFPDPSHPGRAIALANKREVRRRLGVLSAELGVEEPELLADQLLMLMDGAYCTGSLLGSDGPASRTAGAAAGLIELAQKSGRRPAPAGDEARSSQ